MTSLEYVLLPKDLIENYKTFGRYFNFLCYISYSNSKDFEINGLEITLPSLAEIERETGHNAETIKKMFYKLTLSNLKMPIHSEGKQGIMYLQFIRIIILDKNNPNRIKSIILGEKMKELLSPKKNYYKVIKLFLRKENVNLQRYYFYLLKLNFNDLYPTKTKTLFKNLDIKPEEIRNKGRGKLIEEIENKFEEVYSILGITIDKPIYDFHNDIWTLQTINEKKKAVVISNGVTKL